MEGKKVEPVNPLKSFSLANGATPAILFGSFVDDLPAVRQDLKATEAFSFLREALRYDVHPCMARGTGTSIDELRRNAKYIRALLSGYSINSPGRKYKNNIECMRMNFCIDFPTAFKLFLPESGSIVLVRHFYGIKFGNIRISKTCYNSHAFSVKMKKTNSRQVKKKYDETRKEAEV